MTGIAFQISIYMIAAFYSVFFVFSFIELKLLVYALNGHGYQAAEAPENSGDGFRWPTAKNGT